MKKSYIIVITLLVFAGLLTAFEKGMGQDQEDCNGMMQGRFEQKHDGNGMLMHMTEELELTESQVENLQEIHLAHKKSMIQKHSEIKILQLDKDVAMKNKDFAEAKKITKNIFEIKQEMALEKLDLLEDQWNLLTDEQKLKAEEMDLGKKHSQPKMHEGKGMRKGM